MLSPGQILRLAEVTWRGAEAIHRIYTYLIYNVGDPVVWLDREAVMVFVDLNPFYYRNSFNENDAHYGYYCSLVVVLGLTVGLRIGCETRVGAE